MSTDTPYRPASRWLFTVTILVGSFLLFMVQPMVARMALPKLGGAPAVWNSAMLVYQALLLGGYAWAHWIGRFTLKRQVMLHGGLLGLAAIISLPVGLANLTPPGDNQVFLFVPWLLLASVGPLLFAVSAQAPLMQRWFADGAPGANPYALYAASNLGSFGGLIAYPLLVEPNMYLDWQSWSWSVLYLLLLLLVIACGVQASRAIAARPVSAISDTDGNDDGTPSPAPGAKTIALWIALSAVPSGLMLSTTTHLTTDIMAMPLMWAIPLGLYLLSFSIAFGEGTLFKGFFTLLAPPMLFLTGGISMLSQGSGGMVIAATSLIMLFTVAVSLHSRLYSLRPAPDRLTLFYLVMSVGGALGGLFCALIAPLLFDWVYEHPLLLLAAALLIPLPPLVPWGNWLKLNAQGHRIVALALALAAVLAGIWLVRAWTGWFREPELAAIALLVFIGLASIGWRLAYVATLVSLMIGFGGAATLETSTTGQRVRSYFGVYTVRDDLETNRRLLSHGTTLHGTQLTGPGQALTATSYYGPTSGVGLAFSQAQRLYGETASIGVVGLGTGTLACYRRPGQQWTFFEIDPAMVEIARDSGKFSFMPRCAQGVPILLGDARLKLLEVPQHSYNLLAIDAFSSDAIPLHLLTREAFGVYQRAITPDGVVLVHISNRYIDLEPVLNALVQQDGWHAMLRHDEPSEQDEELARTGSIWVAMARDQAALDRLVTASASEAGGRGSWQALDTSRKARLWTDDYASVLPLIMTEGFFR
ncbi:fused MFS/spermidine synthase [Sphingomonas lacunae]|uniref:Fused MFS/spermidine synthase n=1 Tax=Sphingomonas lacunae TaxID=2698828 RepID=A0A6M4ASZ7_9SPHN|nr:fused MFS/spermidine synthase [Sphingomonas lacunae]QJQ32203.1 fused MFS/spermidine synthase [Sphingomonas lacunae]